MKKSKFTLQVEKYLSAHAPRELKSKFLPEHYLKGQQGQISELKFYNYSMPNLKNHISKIAPDIYSENYFKDIQKLWFESDIFEGKMIALYWLTEQTQDFYTSHLNDILKWAHEVDNWAHADTLCSVLAQIYELATPKAEPVFKKWNSHRNPWLRRCSLVGLFYYSRQRKKQPKLEVAKKFIDSHFEAPEYYVQKAVGWTLREMYNVYPEQTLIYIQRNNHRLSSVAWVAASEKLPLNTKKPLLKQRKTQRQKKT